VKVTAIGTALSDQDSASSFFGAAPSEGYGAKRTYLLALALGDSSVTVTSATLGATARPLELLHQVTASGRKLLIYVLRDVSPVVLAGNVSLTLSAATQIVVWQTCLVGVDLADAFGAVAQASGTSTTPSATALEADDYVLSFMVAASATVSRTAGTDVVDITIPPNSPETGAAAGANPVSLSVGMQRHVSGSVPMAWTLGTSTAWLTVAFAVRRFGRETAGYQAWRDSRAVDRTVLAELQPAEQLTSFVVGETYDSAVLGDGPEVYLRLNETSGTVADDAMDAHDGSYSGTPSLGAAGLIANGTAVQFDGTDDFISVPDHADLDITTNLTLEAWVYADGYDVAFPRILAKGASSGNGYQLLVDRDIAGGPKLAVQLEGLTPASFTSTGQLPVTTVTHVVVTYDGSNVRLYLNGSLDSTTPASGSIATNATALFIGQRGDGTARWRGRIDEVAVYGVVLSGPQVAEHYALRTLTGAVYTAAFAATVRPTINGGLRRRLDGVEENGTPYVRVSSVGEVGLYTGSFYYDEATATLYLQTSTGSSPASFSAITAVFTIFLATRAVDFLRGEFYEPRLTGALPETRGEAPDLLFGVAVYPGGQVELQNSDGLFDTLAATWLWRNRKARFLLGGGNLARAEYLPQAELAIEDLQVGRATVLVTLRAQADVLQQLVPRRHFTAVAGSPANVEGADSRWAPILIGTVRDIAPIHWHRSAGVSSIYGIADVGDWLPIPLAVRARHTTTGAVTTLERVVDWFGTTEIFVNAPYDDPAVYEIRCDAVGVAYGGITAARFGSLSLAFLRMAGVAADDIDRYAFEEVDLYSAELAWHQAERITLAELLRLFERSCAASLLVTPQGHWAPRVWLPGDADPTRLVTLDESDMVSQEGEPYQPEPAPSTPLREVVARFAYRPALDEWDEASKSDLGVVGTQRTSESYGLQTALTNEPDAIALAGRYHALQNAKTQALRFTENGFRLIGHGVRDRFLLTLQRAPSVAGAYTQELHEVLEFRKSLGPPEVEAVAANLGGLGAMAKAAAPNSLASVTWDTATPDQKRTYIFAHDDATGRVDALDPSSYAQTRAW
jgi:hypothetical protein